MVKIKPRQNLRTLTLLHLYYVHIILISLFIATSKIVQYYKYFTDYLIAHHTIFIPYDTFWSDKVSSKQGGQLTEFYL